MQTCIHPCTHVHNIDNNECNMSGCNVAQDVHHSSVVWSVGGGAEKEEVDVCTKPLPAVANFDSYTYIILMYHCNMYSTLVCADVLHDVLAHLSVRCDRCAKAEQMGKSLTDQCPIRSGIVNLIPDKIFKQSKH